MTRFLAKRIAFGVLTMLFVAAAIFFLNEILPGDAALAPLGQEENNESLEVVRQRLGLDRPAYVRFASWLSDLSIGNLGVSYGTGTPVAALLTDRLWNTVRLGGLAAAMAFPVGLLLGILSAARPGSVLDKG